jgi:hypothetical protein
MAKNWQEVEEELEMLLTSERADDRYDAIEGARTKKMRRLVLNTDIAREVSPSYRTFANRIAFTQATFKPAQNYVFGRFLDTIEENPGPGRRALLMAGGPASGKSFSLRERVVLENFDLIFDTTLSDYPKARAIVEHLLNFDWDVEIQYVHRPYDLAVKSMLERASCSGRYVSLGQPSRLGRVHMAAQRTFLRIFREFPQLFFGAYGNFWTPDNPRGSGPVDINDLDSTGPLHYDSLDDLHAAQKSVIEEFKEAQESLIAAVESFHP